MLLPALLAAAALFGSSPTQTPAPVSSPASLPPASPAPTPLAQFEELLPIKDGFTPDGVTIESCVTGDLLCLAQGYGNLAYREGTARAGDRLRAAMTSDPAVASFCHPISHGIGLAAIAREENDAARAMRDGFPDCGNGFYHGVLLRAFADLQDADPETLGLAGRQLCGQPAIAADRNLMINCVHGTGHGYMIATAFDMERSIAACTAAGEIGFASVSQCDNGVFMEIFGPSDGSTSPYLSESNPFAPCDRVNDLDKIQCYTYASGRVMEITGGPTAEALRLCDTAEPVGRASCHANIGAAFASAGNAPQATLSFCRAAAGNGPQDCLNGAARQVAFYAVDGLRQSGDYCAAGAEIAELCYRSLGDLIVFQGLADPAIACALYPVGVPRQACIAGAQDANRVVP